MKKPLTILVTMLLCMSARAQLPERLHIGADWGFTATVLNFHHYNYLDESIGFRVDDRGWSEDVGANAYAYISVGMDLTDSFTLGLLTGYAGLNDGVRAIPIEMKVSYFFSSSHQDGFLLFLQGGAAVKTEGDNGLILLGQLGGGYRIALNSRSSLDFKLGIQSAIDHPKVWDPLEQTYISERNIRRDDASYYGLNLGLALEF